ncbi:transposase [Rhodococcus jostii]|uniref:transposase n=1 Tax=Rhodococcus jostii TaxID=132919 RepID=UPI003637D176
MRKTLSRRACGLIAPDAGVIDDTGFVKDGPALLGVARQYFGEKASLNSTPTSTSLIGVAQNDCNDCARSILRKMYGQFTDDRTRGQSESFSVTNTDYAGWEVSPSVVIANTPQHIITAQTTRMRHSGGGLSWSHARVPRIFDFGFRTR